ncbi:MAG: Glycine dehydrogenase [decarboxylating] (glycine cleavage system P protein) (EC [uncultured Thiotrichaceae bacterium]|uniref:Glycine dehydrogenase (decarboxylating) n=1 Tax=uncultured Thiotrichaceae bacterium TaxID=298394 RepID=A0A6S6TI42_9GAMM|nr:MAG: Glycine dehydrogenase [decarboxylating] (glycine cleavage system P protein) (EC [uncultured Thiotrichaceae bacterium]
MSNQDTRSLDVLAQHDDFVGRHIGPETDAIEKMLAALNISSIDELVKKTVPASIHTKEPLALDGSLSEPEVLGYLADLAKQNKIAKSYIGMGYYDTVVPPVILRNVLENPGWYTAYTPYQPEISQGRLEGLLNFQQMVTDLTGMEIANASLLDEATAAAEAMSLCKRSNRLKTNKFLIAPDVHPQTIDVLKTRAQYFDFELLVGDVTTELEKDEFFGVLVQYPGSTGEVSDLETIIQKAHDNKALVCVAADLMSLVMLKSPGEMGADVVMGSAQRFGVPMGYGGPHAAFFATRNKFKRTMPGRIIGVSIDSKGNQALRMAMQTREQHIRREKATSNICTAQALLANMASFYAVYHGPKGLNTIAQRIHRLTTILALGLKQKGIELVNDSWFDTLTIVVSDQQAVNQRATEAGINFRVIDADKLGISLDERKVSADVEELFDVILGEGHGLTLADLDVAAQTTSSIPDGARRTSQFLTHEVFNTHHSETEMLRYLKRLENKDFSLAHGMIPLGSCTMKLNSTSEMIPVTWPEFADIHPFAPNEQTVGYRQMIQELKDWLIEVTGYDDMSMQPNSGAQGEYAGLVAIRRYHASLGQEHRDVCLIPSSAHGTNPASAIMAQMKVVIVECDDNGNIDVEDLRTKAEANKDNLSCVMVTYPSTHGVFEEEIVKVCEIIHENGGQVYMDGANLNAQLGLSKPGKFGSDVSHLNLHKTFCIPHGGGGPGMGPIGVKSHLAPFLPNHAVNSVDGVDADNSAVSAAPYGSAAILPISWVYIKLMGAAGLKRATEIAILNANYIGKRLEAHYPVLYRGANGMIAHECIIDIRPIKAESGVTEEDIAKRLMDYGFHAPTMSFPVAGTLMIEPTESEDLYELDRFCNAMIAIRDEINKVQAGEWPADNNPLVNAPHTLFDITNTWERPYSQTEAILPAGVLSTSKYWPTVNRVDNVYGDRNLVCSCPTVDSYR